MAKNGQEYEISVKIINYDLCKLLELRQLIDVSIKPASSQYRACGTTVFIFNSISIWSIDSLLNHGARETLEYVKINTQLVQQFSNQS